MRKAWSLKDAVKVHQACGLFLWLLDQLQRQAPSGLFPAMKDQLLATFQSKFLDLDLLHVIEEKVPNTTDVSAVAAFRSEVGFQSSVFNSYAALCCFEEIL